MSQRTPTDYEATILAAEFIKHGDQTRAFKAAFPNSKATDKTISERASKTFDASKVRTRIEQLQTISKKNSEEEFTMSVSELKKVLATVIQKTIKSGGSMTAAVSAVREFNTMDGNHAAEKKQIEHSFADLSNEELAQKLKDLEGEE